MEISKYIGQLLFQHDYVVIPEFGGFVANYRPATIHPVQHRFNPPSKSILFNASLTLNDGLLVSHLAGEESLDYDEAEERIRQFVLKARQSIAEGKKVSFENLGTLHADANGNITFDQDDSVNFLTDVYGMDSFVSPAISRQAKRPVAVAPRPLSDSRTSFGNSSLPIKILRVAASVSILFILSFLAYTFLPDSTSSNALTGFLPTMKNAETKSTDNNQNTVAENAAPIPPKPVVIIEKSPEIVIETENIPMPYDSEAINKTMPNAESEVVESLNTEEKQTPTVSAQTVINSKMYHLIAGSFLENENADNLISFYESNGYTPAIIGPSAGGYFRVSIAAYLRKDEALEELNLVRRKFNPNVWLLRQ
jgi:hypothetical protein